jgi:hypothetical protein
MLPSDAIADKKRSISERPATTFAAKVAAFSVISEVFSQQKKPPEWSLAAKLNHYYIKACDEISVQKLAIRTAY